MLVRQLHTSDCCTPANQQSTYLN